MRHLTLTSGALMSEKDRCWTRESLNRVEMGDCLKVSDQLLKSDPCGIAGPFQPSGQLLSKSM